MITVDVFAGRKVAVFGLGRSGVSAARALQRGGAEVLAWDDAAIRREAAGAVLGSGVKFADLANMDWTGVAALVLSPGVPLHFPAPHPCVLAARAAEAEVICDIELFLRMRARQFAATRVVMVTGTNGKSTTTALIGHLLREAGYKAQVGGNIGAAVLDLEQLGPNGVYVLEMSSYQLDLIGASRADVAVLLNITPDHLDRHGGLPGYVAAKRRIFNGLASGACAVIGVDDVHGAEIADDLCAQGVQVRRISIGQQRLQSGFLVQDGTLYEVMPDERHAVTDLRGMERLTGAHNWQNAAAACAVVMALGVTQTRIVQAFHTFPGLAHRMEEVGRIGETRFINDSKATNAEATARALACYDGVHVILGGVPKAGGIDSLAAFFPGIRKAYLIGDAAEAFARTLQGRVAYQKCGNLAAAVAASVQDTAAQNGSVVLLSPACASFDQFENFEERGEAFRRLVKEHMANVQTGRVSGNAA
jgi:UDP-N-acetylmuramoylalanine--D-glutamate ligase